jgi:hypothetical protein
MYGFNHSVSRPVTSELIELAEQGVVDWEAVARAALAWMSEHDVEQFARANEFIVEADEDEDEEESDPMDDFNYVGSPHHY